MTMPELPLESKLFKPGKEIRIFATTPEGTEEFRSKVLEVTSKSIRISGPFEEVKLTLFPLGKQVRIVWPDACDKQGRIPMLDTKIIDFKDYPTPVLHLSVREGFFKWEERRKFLRFPAVFPVWFSAVGEERPERRKMSVDVSEGGIRLSEFIPGEVEIGQKANVKLYISGREEEIKAEGEIAYIGQREEECEVGVKFTTIENTSKKILFEYILILERLTR